MMKSEREVIQIIDKILQLIYDGTDEELNEAIYEMKDSVPFYSKIYNMIFFSNEELTAEEIYQKAKEKNSYPMYELVRIEEYDNFIDSVFTYKLEKRLIKKEYVKRN